MVAVVAGVAVGVAVGVGVVVAVGVGVVVVVVVGVGVGVGVAVVVGVGVGVVVVVVVGVGVGVVVVVGVAVVMFGTIVIDPPWKFDDQGSRIAPTYDLMSLPEIAAFPVAEFSNPDAHLYCWVPDAFTADALEIVKVWGFRYVMDVVWVKTTNDGGKVRLGAGHYLRHATEKALFCVRGKCPPISRSISNVVFAPRGRHSAKPDAFYDMVERVSPGPYIDIFARRNRKGWEVFGNELPEE